MRNPESEDDPGGHPRPARGPLAPSLGDRIWSDLSGRLNRVSARVRVRAHAHGVPALANLLMQGLVL